MGSENTLYVGSMGGRVLALDPANGEEIWPFSIEAPQAGGFGCSPPPQVTIYANPAVSNGIVYVGINFGDYAGRLYAIDAAEGYPRWPSPHYYETGGPIVGGVAVASDTLFVGSSDGKLYAIDATTGRAKEGFTPFQAGDKIWSTPVVEDGSVYYGDLVDKVSDINADTGQKIWEFEADGAIASTPLVHDGTIYIGSFDHRLYAIDAATGMPKVGFEPFEAGDWFWAQALWSGGTVYAASFDHKVYAIDAENGMLRWEFETGGPIRSSPVLVDDLLIVASTSEDRKVGNIYALNAEGGAPEWNYPVAAAVLADLYEANDIVYVHSNDDSLRALEVQSGRELWNVSIE